MRILVVDLTSNLRMAEFEKHLVFIHLIKDLNIAFCLGESCFQSMEHRKGLNPGTKNDTDTEVHFTQSKCVWT